MRNSSYIADNVFGINLEYTKMQNQTKELFFRCLDENRDEEYFENELKKIWNDSDLDLMQEQILEYREMVHEDNTNKKLSEEAKSKINIVGFAVLSSVVLLTNKLFQKSKTKEYKIRHESYAYKVDKNEYLKKLVPKYTSDIKPYYKKGESKTKENIVRYVKPSTYNSMVYNTTLTKNEWAQTLNDGEELGIDLYYIKSHSFSCPHCLNHQERKMTREECLNIYNTAEEGATDLLHPNCKCELVIYEKNTKLRKIKNKDEKIEQYHIREKVMSLTLKKEEILSDIKIQKSLGNEDEIDKLNKQRNKINKSIRELKEALPTTELKKQVVVRNR